MLRKAWWFNVTMMGVALLVTGCSKSSVQLLKDGDAHVCTKSDVTSQLFEIIKQNAGTPDYSKLFPDDSADRVKGWINKVSFSVDGVTSKDVDVPNEKITCNGTVHMSASGVANEQTSSVDYQVVADLSANKPVVTVNIGTSGYALGQIVQAIAAPEVKEAQSQKAAADQDKMKDYENQWAQNHAADIAATRSDIKAKYSTEASPIAGQDKLTPDLWPYSKLFSSDDQALMVRAETMKAMCLQNMAASDNIVCSQRDLFFKQLHDKDICYTGESWFHCSKHVPPGPVAAGNSGPFTPAETAVVNQAQDLTDRCRDAEGGQNPQICDQSQAIVEKLKTMNICYGPEDAIEADKHWVRCSGS